MVLADSSPCVEAERKRRAGDRRHHQQDQGQIGHFFWNKIPRIFRKEVVSSYTKLNQDKTFPTYLSFQERKKCIAESILYSLSA